MTNTKTPRRATTEIGRAILQRERQKLAREQAALGEALVREAAVIRSAPAERYGIEPTDTEHNAIARGIVRRIGAVLSSEGVNVPISVRKGEEGVGTNAWTDFTQISVTYRPVEDKRVLAATLRGLFYHEGGHCRWTLPYQQLWQQVRAETVKADGTQAPIAQPTSFPEGTQEISIRNSVHQAWNILEDQRMETAVVSDSPRKAAYLTPLIMTEHTPTPTAMAANYPLLIWRKYLPRKIRQAARKMFVANHNILGKDGESLARQAEAIVNTYVLATDVLTMWQAVCDFHDLLQEIQPVASKDFGHQQQRRSREVNERDLDDYLIIPIDSEMMDEGMGEPVEADDTEPEIDFTDPAVAEHLTEVLIAMWNHPESLVPVIYASTSAAPSNEDAATPSSAPADESESDPSDGDSESDEGDDEGDDGKDDDGKSAKDGDSDSDSDDKEGDSDGAGSDGAHTDDGANNVDDGDFGQDDLDEMLQEAEDERNEMRELDGDLRAFDNAREQTSGLPVYVGGLSSDIPAINKSVALADEIERSFHMSTMDRQPAWVEGQRRGIVNVLRYETRRPGQADVFRQWTEDDQPGYDMAVSLLLDYSGSMSDHMVELAQSAYAVKLACQRLNIPCTVSLWDTDATVLWDANEMAEGMPVLKEAGGTDPTRALQDLDNQRFDRSKHIVMVMTDGDWQAEWVSSKRTLAAYKDAGRQIYGFGLGGRHLREGLISKGCDNAWGIHDLMEIPQRLEQFLVESA